ncbi:MULTISPECIES: hypothetical protein [Luteimonas]|uniref:hypothetical protein n=1 Tax=Luteimonas TaxID=83614 RepID=UPI000C7D0FB7|nr:MULTISPECIES: hypothetical protein [Luteimonas]
MGPHLHDTTPGLLATRLALLGLPGGARARHRLPGVERVRVTLAAAAWAQPAAPLLLLSGEPSGSRQHRRADHAVARLAGSLLSWALLVVGHDPALPDTLAMRHRLRLEHMR